jgi:hypothetical protein
LSMIPASRAVISRISWTITIFHRECQVTLFKNGSIFFPSLSIGDRSHGAGCSLGRE